jgi:hypothetical protein
MAGNNNVHRGPAKDKPFRAALVRKIVAAENDPDALDRIAEALKAKALEGDVQAIREIADRLDGKVPQGVIGGDDDDPAIKTITKIELIGVRPES